MSTTDPMQYFSILFCFFQFEVCLTNNNNQKAINKHVAPWIITLQTVQIIFNPVFLLDPNLLALCCYCWAVEVAKWFFFVSVSLLVFLCVCPSFSISVCRWTFFFFFFSVPSFLRMLFIIMLVFVCPLTFIVRILTIWAFGRSVRKTAPQNHRGRTNLFLVVSMSK